jgi:hypothetical protein
MAKKLTFIAPNSFQLQGGGISVSYSTTGIDGKPHLSYQDAFISSSFSGDQINTVKTSIGSLVTVVIRLTVDSGSTSFTVLIPVVNLPAPDLPIPIETVGITTVHRFSIVPRFNQGQIELYSVTPLVGTAIHVEF